MTNDSIHVAVVDIGSLRNLGWAIEGPFVNAQGADIDLCIEALARALTTGPLALGFEAPMFIPYGRKRSALDKARVGENDRAFSASAGACVLTKGLVVVPYILEGLRSQVDSAKPTFRWREPLSGRQLLLFEAFVTHQDRSVSHEDCARLAIRRFPRNSEDTASLNSAITEEQTLNLLGAMLLRMGWTDDVTVLSEPCLVIRDKGNSN